MTNTNYHIAFDRMFARGATSEIDATFSNPAGLAWGREGFQLSLNFQKPWQRRNIELNNTTYKVSLRLRSCPLCLRPIRKTASSSQP